MARDHPRSRGVYLKGTMAITRRSGSSPLARGLHNPDQGPFTAVGIIPARAGFTRMSRKTVPACEDHPRSRGVYLMRLRINSFAVGSSPLARGLLGVRAAAIRRCRIIPARAGFTSRGRSPFGRRSDHPRSRGVYLAG